MVFNEDIDNRVKNIAAQWPTTSSKKMFGGVCHLLNGNMFCGVLEDSLILRLGEDKAKEALKCSQVRPFDVTGKPMKGWIMIDQAAISTEEELQNWLNLAREFAQTLPPKLKSR